MKTKQVKASPKGPKKLITISREIGTGGRKIADKLGGKLACTVWGREILDAVVKQSGGNYQARMFEALDEHAQGLIDMLVNDFFGRVGKHTYQHLLPKAILTVAQNDAIFVGRGVNMILPEAFHVRIRASMETRIQNMMTYEGLDRKTAEKKIKDVDRERDAFMKEFAHTINVKYYHEMFDLGINMDRIDVDEAVSIILHAFELFQKRKKK
jgi:hypothetical protein